MSRIRFVWTIVLAAAASVLAEPKSGDVFREYHMFGMKSDGDREWILYVSYHGTGKGSTGDRFVEGVDLNAATKAEFVAIHWGGHIGSDKRRIIFNDNPAVELPLIQNTPTQPQCYFSQQCHAACEIPLSHLKPGTNAFRLAVDNQICYSFNWGWFWTYQAILRVYYDPSEVSHPSGKMAVPSSGSVITDGAEVSCDARSPDSEVDRVEFVGWYKDFSWEGSGQFTQWHWGHWRTDENMKFHIGTATGGDRSVSWDNRWVPDQDGIQIAARVRDRNGYIYMTDPVESIRLTHGDKIVKMYPAKDVPENFATQTGSKSCTINVPDDQKGVLDAKLVVTTFSGGSADREGYLNNSLINKGGWGEWHQVGLCQYPVETDAINKGDNTFEIRANYAGHHAFEVNWPGPVLFVEYENDNPLTTQTSRTALQEAGTNVALSAGGLAVHNPSGREYSVRVMSLDGRTILSTRGSGTRQHHEMSPGSLTRGLYVVHLRSRDRQSTLRMAVIR
ncbi:MAG: hypothetical protein GF418_05240 [Chitinivibrionales bacterium]|nr:hypothetical protein [Chitinivibrionales bacterium]MBD3395015.1 hypothetical protein [Chitinivibrionales bacterium]